MNASCSPSTTVLYLAYGSMCNRESLRRRGINPSLSCPAILRGWTLTFDNVGGMADVLEGLPPALDPPDGEQQKQHQHGPVFCLPPPPPPRDGKEGGGDSGDHDQAAPPPLLHGVLHVLTPQEWDALAAIEAVYGWRELPVRPYGPRAPAMLAAAAAAAADGGPEVLARVFVAAASAKQQQQQRGGHESHAHDLPTDRYLGIICMGLEEFGADPRWVQQVRALPCERTPGPGEHVRLPGPLTRAQELEEKAADGRPPLPRRSRAWLARRQGVLDPAMTFALGPRIFRAAVASDAPMRPILCRQVAGKQAALGFVLNLFDPRLPPLGAPGADNDGEPRLEEVHVAYAEHHFARMPALVGGEGGKEGETGGGGGAKVQHVGWLVRDGEENDDEAPE